MKKADGRRKTVSFAVRFVLSNQLDDSGNVRGRKLDRFVSDKVCVKCKRTYLNNSMFM